MFKRNLQLLTATWLAAGALWAADNPFVGTWKLIPSRSKFIDVMKVESFGGNKYGFDFGGGNPEKIALDGTDQPGLAGTTLSVAVEGPDAWKVVRKKDGRTLLTGNWKLSQDGNTLTDNYTEFGPNGSSTVNYLYKRTAGGKGFAGTWEATMTMDEAFLLRIRPYEGAGLSFIRSPEDTRNVKFDGKEYPNAGGSAQNSTSSARQVDERTLEITDRTNGKTTRMIQVELSPDLKTLTRTVRPVGQHEPNVFVFERQ